MSKKRKRGIIPGLGHLKGKAEEEGEEEEESHIPRQGPRCLTVAVPAPYCTMGSLQPGHWPLILVHTLLLQLHPVKVQGIDPVSQKLRRLNEQFQQFQALTQARLDMLARNQNRNSTRGLESHVQALNNHYHHLSQDLEHLRQSTTQEIEALREWRRKLEKKSKRMEGRVALMERNLRENRRRFQKEPDLSQDFSDLSQELQSQEERLAALQVQRDELLVGLRGLQESLTDQALRVTRVEGRLSEVLHLNGGKIHSNVTPQEYYEPRRRGQSQRGGRPGMVPGAHSQPRETSQTKTYGHSQVRQKHLTRVTAQTPQASEVLPPPRSELSQKGEEEAESEMSVIHHFLRLPVRHKIPERPVPKKDSTICNVDSVLFFPSASAENYVTFSPSLPDLPELSMCLWVRVEASHMGTLFSYATEDNDNQLVLYGRNSSSLSPFSLSSYSASSPSLDFVIGDPVYRRLPMASPLDAAWHHLCILWSSIQGHFWHYTDRRLTSSGSNFRKGWEVPGGGSVVLGQEQDSVGGGFDPAEGFAGQMSGFRLWNRVLSPSEVDGVAEGRGVPRGVVLDMGDIKEVHGEVQQVECECLEHCI